MTALPPRSQVQASKEGHAMVVDGHATEEGLAYPFPEPPGPGQAVAVAPGVLAIRLSLPFRLNHVNLYLIEDDAGYVLVDAGLATDRSRAEWEALLAGPLRGIRLTRVIVTHSHPDHIGLAGWLCRRFDAELLTSQTSWLTCQHISLSPGALDTLPYRQIFKRHGLDEPTTDIVVTQGHRYLAMVEELPPTFRRIVGGDTLRIGGRDFQVLSGDGHAAEQIMLHCAADKLFLAADQVLARITPNVSVWAADPDGDPLALYLRSLAALKSQLAEDVLVLPGHELAFRGLHRRCDSLRVHHEHRCELIERACARAPHSVADLVPVLFPRVLDPHQLGFAFSEAHAHVNFLIGANRLRWIDSGNGERRAVLGKPGGAD
jgi:glyoxylase-like metal-dependent hydrolase (beta-lactamase superfamily II)